MNRHIAKKKVLTWWLRIPLHKWRSHQIWRLLYSDCSTRKERCIWGLVEIIAWSSLFIQSSFNCYCHCLKDTTAWKNSAQKEHQTFGAVLLKVWILEILGRKERKEASKSAKLWYSRRTTLRISSHGWRSIIYTKHSIKHEPWSRYACLYIARILKPYGGHSF